MNNNFQSSLSLSLKQLINKKMLKIFFLHFFLTYTIAGIIVYFCSEYFINYFNEVISNIFNFFSSNNSPENLIFSIARVISYLISWFIFIYILIPISSITGLIFEDVIFKKIMELRNMDFKFKKIKISIIYMFIFVLKNFLTYLLLNLIAIPFYLTLPGLNILIFIWNILSKYLSILN